jgi:hypothetical protein
MPTGPYATVPRPIATGLLVRCVSCDTQTSRSSGTCHGCALLALDRRASRARAELHDIILSYRALAIERHGFTEAGIPELEHEAMTELEKRARWGDR